MEGEGIVLMCLPVEGDPSRYIVPSSVQDRCNDCGTEVWVAPSGQQLIRERATVVVCMDCAQVRVNKKPGALVITGEQVKEVKAWKRRN